MAIEGFKRGDQVRFSEKGRRVYSRNQNQIGAVVNNPQNPRTMYLHVRWAGNQYSDKFHPAFIEKVE